MPTREQQKAKQLTAKRAAARQQHTDHAAPQQADARTAPTTSRPTRPVAKNIDRERPPAPQVVKKIIRAERDEAKTLTSRVFHSDPDSQIKEFIKNAATIKKTQMASLKVAKTPAESHPPLIEKQLLESDDEVADNLDRLFSKTSNTVSKSRSD